MKKRQRTGGEGHLPSSAPLANPFVPFQQENPPRYEARKALIRGTVFPGLDLPFKGMVNTREKPVTALSELQVMAFVIQDLALYLDTHRDDKEALALYQSYQQLYHDCVREYTESHGPLNHHNPTRGAYRWLDDPWPWEYCKNKEA